MVLHRIPWLTNLKLAVFSIRPGPLEGKQKEKHRDVADAIARFLTKYSETAKDPQAGSERKCSKFSGLGVSQQGSRV